MVKQLKISNLTALIIFGLFGFALVVLGLIALGFVSSGLIGQTLVWGIISIVAGVILLIETFLEGTKPKLNKGQGVWSLIIAIISIVVGALMWAEVVIPQNIMPLIGVNYLLLAGFIYRELFR